MGKVTIAGVVLTQLKTIFHPKGNVFHAMKKSDAGFNGFGEAYFSTANCGDVKGWKKHIRMTMNLVVPVGEIRFVIYDDRNESSTKGSFFDVCLSQQNYQRLTVPPGVWMGFKGIGNGLNLVLNLADMVHDQEECENITLESIPYEWGVE